MVVFFRKASALLCAVSMWAAATVYAESTDVPHALYAAYRSDPNPRLLLKLAQAAREVLAVARREGEKLQHLLGEGADILPLRALASRQVGGAALGVGLGRPLGQEGGARRGDIFPRSPQTS